MLPYGTNKNYLDWDDNEARVAAARRENKIIIEESLEEMEEMRIAALEEELERRYGCSEYDYFEDLYWEGNKEPVRLTYRPIILVV